MTIESLLETAEETFHEAEKAYNLEWVRGTWVFKFFPKQLRDYRDRLGAV
jgi:hypothetical protein